MQMTDDLAPSHRRPKRTALGRRGAGTIQLSTTIALVVLLALAVITISIGIAQADVLSEMVDDETGRLALIGLVLVIAATGGITATMMWLTAPQPNRRASPIPASIVRPGPVAMHPPTPLRVPRSAPHR